MSVFCKKSLLSVSNFGFTELKSDYILKNPYISIIIEIFNGS